MEGIDISLSRHHSEQDWRVVIGGRIANLWHAHLHGVVFNNIAAGPVRGRPAGRDAADAVRALPCREARTDGPEFRGRERGRFVPRTARWNYAANGIGGLTSSGESRSGTAAARGGKPDR